MKIRIDPHLESFEIIRQLKEMVIEYNRLKTSGEYPDPDSSFENFLYSQSIDPVKRFLLLSIPELSVGEDVNYDQMINYWTEKFQTFRGTLKIFDYLKEIGGIMGIIIGRGEPGDEDYIPPYSYDNKTLEVNFVETETTDINLLVKAGEEFFKSLLYFQELRDTYETLKLDLTSEMYVNLTTGSQFYSLHTIIDDGI